MPSRAALGDRRNTLSEPVPASADHTNTGSASVALTLAANSSYANAVDGWNVGIAGGTNSASVLVITDDTVTVRTYRLPVIAAGQFIQINDPIKNSAVNKALTGTLTATGSASCSINAVSARLEGA